MWHLDLFDAQILAQNVINGADSFPLLAVPFFMLAGEIMNVGGLSQRIVNFALALVGHIKGGLGYVAIVAAILLSALSGSAVADAAALTALLLPMMVTAGHDKARSGGLIAAVGRHRAGHPAVDRLRDLRRRGQRVDLQAVPGRHLPRHPDRRVAVADLDVPGAQGEDRAAAAQDGAPRSCKSLRDATWALMLPVIILVGLRFGVFTPTEAAVVAAVYALLRRHRDLPRAEAQRSCTRSSSPRPRPPR